MRPLRVTLVLDTPFVEGPHPTHLDDLIAWCCVQEAQVRGRLESFDDVLSALPLEREERDGQWVWKASAMTPEKRLGVTQRYINRRFWEEGFSALYAEGMVMLGEKDKIGQMPDVRSKQFLEAPSGAELLKTDLLSGKIDTLRGHNKNASFLYPVVNAPAVLGFCIGDAERIESLLKTYLTHFGKRARLGHGRIKQILVEEDPQAQSCWDERHLPWPKDGYQPLAATVRPPYWDRAQAVMAWRPARFGECHL